MEVARPFVLQPGNEANSSFVLLHSFRPIASKAVSNMWNTLVEMCVWPLTSKTSRRMPECKSVQARTGFVSKYTHCRASHCYKKGSIAAIQFLWLETPLEGNMSEILALQVSTALASFPRLSNCPFFYSSKYTYDVAKRARTVDQTACCVEETAQPK